MIRERIAEVLSTKYEKRLLIFDTGNFVSMFDYLAILEAEGYCVVPYDDVEALRLRYEQEIKKSTAKWAVVVSDDAFIPFDILSGFYQVSLSLSAVFPKLDDVVMQKHIADLDIISFTYGNVFSSKLSPSQTERYIAETVFSKDNVKKYCDLAAADILPAGSESITYSEWINIAKKKSMLDVYAAKVGIEFNTSFIDGAFEQFVLGDYQKLSGQTSRTAPTILPKVFDFIGKGKTALIVMDCMSLFDFDILSGYFEGIEYDYQCSYALIPTMTAISRQSLLSGKYPRQLDNPFSLNKEESGFYNAAEDHGLTKQQTMYTRGYDVQPSPFTKLIAVTINDVDDMVHGQQQGRTGMFNDITLLAKSEKLQTLIRSLYRMGFTVYLTADHGNTLCRGVGSLRSTGVEVETKAKRMLILKDFAETIDGVKENTIEYPAYFLDKSYRYLICKSGVSFDNKNSEVMTHGGISIDEVIVPFVKIKAVV